MSDDTPDRKGLRSGLRKPEGRRAIGFFSHGGAGADIPRDADGTPRKARGTRQASGVQEPQVESLDAIPVKPFSLSSGKAAAKSPTRKAAPKPSSLGPGGKKR